jgi:hypothetical protein
MKESEKEIARESNAETTANFGIMSFVPAPLSFRAQSQTEQELSEALPNREGNLKTQLIGHIV